MLYFDYAASTPLKPSVRKIMHDALSMPFGICNPNSFISAVEATRTMIQEAQKHVADSINATPDSIFWTSGATESINLALKGSAQFYKRNGNHIITFASEHKAVLHTLEFLNSNGFEVTVLPVQKNGCLCLNQVKNAIRENTLLISLCHVNNELGVIQPLKEISIIAKENGILLHVDASQSIGKENIDVSETPIDFLSLSAHKSYGPKGIGALYISQSPKRHVIPLLHGSGFQSSVRGGTPPTHQILGMGEAFRIAKVREEFNHICELNKYFISQIHKLPIRINAADAHRVPHIVNITLLPEHADTESIFNKAILSKGSACRMGEPSHVLASIGMSLNEINRSIRISFGMNNTLKEIDSIIELLSNSIL